VQPIDSRSVGVLLAVEPLALRGELQVALAAADFPKPLLADDAAQLRQALADADLDLIVLTSRLADEFVAPMIGEVRRGTLGPRPFPIVVILVADADPVSLRQASNCGPDDVIALPCAPQDLLDRINWFLGGNRRELVVNDGYAGPERRTQRR
jgi:DNA-binding response OmpR family regulator